MKRISVLFILMILSVTAVLAANGDTTTVRVWDKHHMDHYGNYDKKVKLPDASKKHQRIWLKYTLGCLSNGQCEWDYTLKLFVREHTGTPDSTLRQAPLFRVNGATPSFVAYAGDTTWVNVFNTTTKKTDSVPSTFLTIILFTDTLNPLVPTDTLNVFSAGYYRHNFDSTGKKTDSTWVSGINSIIQKYTPYYEVFEVINNIELGRFISPYAKTFPKTFQYDYVYDVTDYAGLLSDSTEFRIEYQGYSYGFTATWDMIFVEGTPARDVVKVRNIYNGGFNYGQTVSIEEALKATSFTVPSDAVATKARIIITGHGGESSQNCAEFCPKNMYLMLNNQQIAEQLVWKDDCGSNAITAQPGTWIYNRANWCPGEKIRNYDYMLNVTPGSTNTIDLDMEQFTASGAASYNIALQLIHYKANNFTTDAAIEDIIAPSKNLWHSKMNPICDNARIIMKNWGSQPLTSAEISCQIGNGTARTYNWTGNLAYDKEEELKLPELPWPSDLTNRTFKVWISKINGAATDDNMHNNAKESTFDLPIVVPNRFIIETRTNAVPEQNSYRLMDESDGSVVNRTFSSANLLHRDTFNLKWGCYTFRFNDEGGNGLGWWAAPGEGNGLLRIMDPTKPSSPIRTFSLDFGSFTQLSFRVQYTTGIENELVNVSQISVYPNPAFDQITIEGFEVKEAIVTDIAGKKIMDAHHSNTLNVKELPSGVYLLQITNASGQTAVRKIAVSR